MTHPVEPQSSDTRTNSAGKLPYRLWKLQTRLLQLQHRLRKLRRNASASSQQEP
ncbi:MULTISPECIES: hypothetical protein [Thiomicrorhabdus]|uniref:Uncharacterized protein n=1 Tax=Thiomicrorhabdus heinhorstiae TaxID=2748010 RepID=A0ABS0BYS5_9GAMM|nr:MULTISPECIES: hypothetical protein [Thiomicrorhabdus]MBF6058238.1 hypothetical protein [Thiomicrorhabdus heinhorstiae]